MVCRVFEVKIKKGKLSKKIKTHLNNLFTEAKWVMNAVLGMEDVYTYDDKTKSV
jgi:hypothetical protein